MPHRSDYDYDAWNRVVEVRLPDADSPIASIEAFEYDGLNRRIRKTVTNWGTGIVMDSLIDTEGVQAGDREERYFYAGWRVIEERTGGGDVIAQTVWGTEYIDAPICRDRNTKFTNDDCLDEDSRRYFYHQDINFRVTALTDESGEIVERYDYDAYGAARIYSGGAVANSGEGGVLLAVSSVGNPYMHQGLRRDDETGTFENRMRCYNPRIGRFMQRDPAGYVDGMNLYAYLDSAAWSLLDPLGLEPCAVLLAHIQRHRVRAAELRALAAARRAHASASQAGLLLDSADILKQMHVLALEWGLTDFAKIIAGALTTVYGAYNELAAWRLSIYLGQAGGVTAAAGVNEGLKAFSAEMFRKCGEKATKQFLARQLGVRAAVSRSIAAIGVILLVYEGLIWHWQSVHMQALFDSAEANRQMLIENDKKLKIAAEEDKQADLLDQSADALEQLYRDKGCDASALP